MLFCLRCDPEKVAVFLLDSFKEMLYNIKCENVA